jgi:hypothetical protein
MSWLRTMPPFLRGIVGLPEHDRLMAYITDAWADFDREVQSVRDNPGAVTEPWARSACGLLLRAEAHLANWDIEQGWAAVLSAQRAILSNPHNPKRIERAAIVLRREADKITGWRAKAIQDLICSSNGKLISFTGDDKLTQESLKGVIEAIALRDDFSQNTWFKIVLRKRHLFSLFLILWLAIALVLILSSAGVLPGFLSDTSQLCLVILFGVLGAGVSVAQSLILQDVSERIPIQQMGALVVWMRPGIGAAAALAVFALLHANQHFKIFNLSTTEPSVIAVFSFVAGYSERFIIGTLERITQSK